MEGPHDAAGRHAAPEGPARCRILETAYELFSTHGIHAIGIDRIVAEAEVAKTTLYRHFPSKEALVLAFLELRERRWTREWLQAEMERRAQEPAQRLLAAFDALGEWFAARDFESCSFIRTLLEAGGDRGPVYQASVRHLDAIRGVLMKYAEQAGAEDPGRLARELQTVMMGAITSASCGDAAAAPRARDVAALLVARACP
jgi:AcrR family transcriptional regulator